jgi:hypothetical protein
MTLLPKIWKDGNSIKLRNQYGMEVLAKCIDKEDFKINRLDKPCVLFHTSSKPEFMQYIRSMIKDYNLEMIGVNQ